jgi:hypothetical protein
MNKEDWIGIVLIILVLILCLSTAVGLANRSTDNTCQEAKMLFPEWNTKIVNGALFIQSCYLRIPRNDDTVIWMSYSSNTVLFSEPK